MLVCVLAVLAVGVPGIVAAIGDLSESQRLEALGRLNARSVALAHSLADERDEMALFVAGGRSTAGGTGGVTEDQRARVDRQADDVSAFAADVDADDDPAAARQTSRIGKLLAGLPELRQSALSGPGSARTTFDGYSELVDALNGLSATIATRLPGRAADEDTAALPALTRAVDRATAQRGLLLVALGAGGPQSGTVRAAQQAVVGERAALADFDAAASRAGADRYAETVTGKETDDAEALVARLTDGGALTGGDLRVQPDDLKSSLTARIDRMRSVESSLAADSAARLRDMRDDDVVALEIRAGLTGVAALLVLGLTVTVSRSVVRPLAGLHRAARDLNGRLLSELDRTDHEVTDPQAGSTWWSRGRGRWCCWCTGSRSPGIRGGTSCPRWPRPATGRSRSTSGATAVPPDPVTSPGTGCSTWSRTTSRWYVPWVNGPRWSSGTTGVRRSRPTPRSSARTCSALSGC